MFPKASEVLIPSITERYLKLDQIKFEEKLLLAGKVSIFSAVFIVIAIVLSSPLIMKLFDLEHDRSEVFFIFAFLGADFILATYQIIFNLVVHASGKTKVMLIATPVRQFVFLASASLLVPKWPLEGMAFSKLLGALGADISVFVYILKNDLISKRTLAHHTLTMILGILFFTSILIVYQLYFSARALL